MKVELTKLTITVQGGVLELAITEAEELYKQLHKLFGEKIVNINTPVYIERDKFPSWPYISPPNTNPPQYGWPVPPTITCHAVEVSELDKRYTGAP